MASCPDVGVVQPSKDIFLEEENRREDVSLEEGRWLAARVKYEVQHADIS